MEPSLARMTAAWQRSDALFDSLAPEAWLERPIPLRHPFLFYLGHLPAFAWNQIGCGLLGRAPFDDASDRLFERGIDPVGVDEAPEVNMWPSLPHVLAYRDRVRRCLREVWDGALQQGDRAWQVLWTAIEHEWMHHETLLYMVQQLPANRKRKPAAWPELCFGSGAAAGHVAIPAGCVMLGARRGSLPFGWDNEFPALKLHVDAFRIDRMPVRCAEFLEFVEDGGYGQRSLWTDASWAWRARRSLEHPLFWRREGGGWLCRTVFEEVPLRDVRDWPISVSAAEARAFAAWRGERLPTEAEWARAAYGAPDGSPRAHPWGDAAPGPQHGNFGWCLGGPSPVGSHPAGQSAWGVLDLVGDGWEWTQTPFAPFPGFEPMSHYPGYSRDFFDGGHLVLLGASWATHVGLVRRSFRNWFQPHYPYVFAKFRCVQAPV